MDAAQPANSGAAIQDDPAPRSYVIGGVDFDRQIPDPCTVLGLSLRPMSLGRYRRLARHGVAFVADAAAAAKVEDLLTGVLICAMPCAEWDELANRPAELAAVVAEWMRNTSPLSTAARLLSFWPRAQRLWYAAANGWRRSPMGWYERRWRKSHSFDLDASARIFQKYVADAQRMPRYYSTAAREKAAHTHWADSMELVMREKIGWTAAEIDEQPLSKAIADYLNWAYQEGYIELYTEDDMDTAKRNSLALAAMRKSLSGKFALEGLEALDALAKRFKAATALRAPGGAR